MYFLRFREKKDKITEKQKKNLDKFVKSNNIFNTFCFLEKST